jgi:hypothetical protein
MVPWTRTIILLYIVLFISVAVLASYKTVWTLFWLRRTA